MMMNVIYNKKKFIYKLEKKIKIYSYKKKIQQQAPSKNKIKMQTKRKPAMMMTI